MLPPIQWSWAVLRDLTHAVQDRSPCKVPVIFVWFVLTKSSFLDRFWPPPSNIRFHENLSSSMHADGQKWWNEYVVLFCNFANTSKKHLLSKDFQWLTNCTKNSVLMRRELSWSVSLLWVSNESISSMKITAGWWHLHYEQAHEKKKIITQYMKWIYNFKKIYEM